MSKVNEFCPRDVKTESKPREGRIEHFNFHCGLTGVIEQMRRQIVTPKDKDFDGIPA